MFGNAFGPTGFDLKFRLFGVNARVHPSFWLGGLIFTRGSPGISLVLTGIATLFVSIFVHEMGHALSGKFFGDRVPSITLHAMGGHYTPGNTLRHGRFIWMVLWGPLAGFILGAIAIGARFALEAHLLPFSVLLWYAIYDLMWINITWGLVNLLPVFPLDGGQILREVVRWKFPLKTDAFSYTVSMITAMLVALGMFAADYAFGFGIYPVILFGMLAFQNYQLRQQFLAMGEYQRYEEEAPRQPWEQDADWWKKN